MIMEIYGNLPANIIYKILSYVHNPQPPELLEDIKNYYTSTNHILYYYDVKNTIMNIFEEPWDWLNNDVISFMNSYKPTMWGYVPYFYTIILRNPFIHPVKRMKYFTSVNGLDNTDYTYKAYLYIQRIENMPSKRGFRLLWGLLNIKEREYFIKSIIIEINYLHDFI
jgi:hypothetical protein